ncbi:MAG: hypothetical protein ACJ8LM_17605 [Candidatus Udaeobacter sp.]
MHWILMLGAVVMCGVAFAWAVMHAVLWLFRRDRYPIQGPTARRILICTIRAEYLLGSLFLRMARPNRDTEGH